MICYIVPLSQTLKSEINDKKASALPLPLLFTIASLFLGACVEFMMGTPDASSKRELERHHSDSD